MKNNKWQKKGSLALEAALTMPLVLLITALFINVLTAYIAETRLKAAMDRTAQELSMLVPLCDLALTYVAEDGFPEPEPGPDSLRQSELIASLDSLGRHLWPNFSTADIISDLALDLASSALLGPFIQQRLDFWLAQADPVATAWNSQIAGRRLYLDFRLEKQQLWLCLNYEITTVFGPVKRYLQAAVPLWIGSGDHDPADDDGLWSLDNLTRGQIIRQRLGTGLPYDFPVIASFTGDRATAVCSMDLTAPTYESAGNIEKRIISQVERLAAFSGTVYRRENEVITITAEQIKSRELVVVIPQNSPEQGVKTLEALVGQAAARGVDLKIRALGVSSRFLNPDS